MDNVFKSNEYITPDNKRCFMDKLFLNSRWYFYKNYFSTILDRNFVDGKHYNYEEFITVSKNVFDYTEKCGGKFHLYGLNNLEKSDEPVVYVANHMGVLETFVLPYLTLHRGPMSLIAKESLVSHFLFGKTMRATDPIVVTRKNPREDFTTVMKDGVHFIKNRGKSIVVFPQSTRSSSFIPKEFNTIGIKLAKSAGVKVIPIALKTDFLGNGKILKDLGAVHRDRTIYFKFGEPITIEGNGKEQHKQIIEFIKENLLQWGGKISLE